MDDEALSPVIGTVLLVAIAVVLAAVVFIAVSVNNEPPPEIPRVGFKSDFTGAGGTLTVVRVEADAGEFFWEDTAVAPSSTAACTLPTGEVDPNDVITCATEGTFILTYVLPGGDTVVLYQTEIK